jgi:hypothetical protein
MTLDSSIRKHSKDLTLLFGALIVVATTLAITLPTESTNTKSKKDKNENP